MVIERAALGGQAATAQWLDNVPGFANGISGAEFSSQLRRQTDRFGLEVLQAQDVLGLRSHDNYHCIDTADGSEYSAALLIR